MNNRGSKLAGVSTVLMALLMVLSVFAAPVAAVNNVDNAGTPADIAAQNPDVTQDVADTDMEFEVNTGGGVHAIKVDISSLTQAGVDISGASVSSANVETDDSDDVIDFARVNQENEEIRLVIDDNSGTSLDITSLPLEGLDTSGVDSQTGLDYVVELDNGNVGDFGNFQVDALGTTGQFNVAFVENVDQDETYSSISAALTASELSQGDTIEVGPGTYDEQVFVAVPDVTLTSTQGANDTTITFDGTAQGANPKSEETVSIHAGGVTVEGFTIERADGANDDGATQAVAVRQTAGSNNPVEVSNNIVNFPQQTQGTPTDAVGIQVRGGSSGDFAQFDNADFASSDSVDVEAAQDADLDLSNVVVENNEVDVAPGAGSASASAVGVFADDQSSQDYSDITVQNNDLPGEDASANTVGVFVAEDGGSNTASNIAIQNNNIEQQEFGVSVSEFGNEVSVTGNEFVDNAVHVNQDDSDFDLDAAFENNDFVNADGSAQYAIAENVDDNLQGAVYGQLDDLVDDTAANNPDVFTDDQTTTLAGNHTVDSTISGGASDVVVTSAANAEARIINDGGADPVFDLSSATNGVEISDLTVESGNTVIGTSNADQDDLTFTNNEFVGVDGTDAITISDTVGNGLTITDNTFSSDAAYTGINLNGNLEAAANEQDADVSGNTIDSTASVNNGIQIGALGSSDLAVVVEDNAILNASTTGISVDYNDEGAELTVSSNDISGTGSDAATGLDIDVQGAGSGSALANVLIEANTLANLDDGAGDGTGLLINSNTEDVSTDNIVDNEFNGNAEHFDLTSANYGTSEVETIVNNNAFDPIVAASSAEQSLAVEDLAADRLHGTVEGAVNEGEAHVNVGPGTYEEDQIVADTADQEILSIDSAAQPVITTENEQNILDIDGNNVVVDGFTFNSETDDGSADVSVTNGAGGADGVAILNSTFTGPGTDAETRTAISISNVGSSPTVDNVDIDGYGTGIDVSVDTAATVSSAEISGSNVGVALSGTAAHRLEDSTITGSGTGVDLNSQQAFEIVRNQITDNTVGIESNAGGNAVIHFNDILNNADAGVDYATDGQGSVDSLRANWWGDANGPDVSTETGADIVQDSENDVANSGDGDQARPWLTSSYTELPTDRMVVVTDASAPPADADPGETEGARVLVAVLDDDLASSASAGNTVFVVDGPDSLIDADDDSIGDITEGDLSVDNPLQAPEFGDANGDSLVPQDDTPGDYEIQAVNTEDAVDSGSAVQQYSGAVADVNVTTDTTELAADGDTTANVTLQLVDSDGNPVPRDSISTSYSIDNSQAAGAERVNADGTTDANGEATLTLTAETAGETITVTGIDDANNNADTVEINTVEPSAANFTLDLVEGPTTITQNESYSATVNVTNTGDAAGTQDITYNLEDSNGLSQVSATEEDVQLNASASQEVTFEVAASDTESLSTGDFTHVFSSNDDELTLNVTVQAADEPGQVALENTTLDPSSVSANTTNDHDLTFDAINVSDDGNTDSFTVTIPSAATLESANSVSVVDANGTDVSLSGGPDVSGNEITFDVAPDSSADTRTLSVTANVTVTAPDVENETTADITVDVSDSNNGQDSADVTLTVEPAEEDRFDTNGEPGIQSGEVLNAISAFNENTRIGGEPVESGDVLDVISAFNEA